MVHSKSLFLKYCTFRIICLSYAHKFQKVQIWLTIKSDDRINNGSCGWGFGCRQYRLNLTLVSSPQNNKLRFSQNPTRIESFLPLLLTKPPPPGALSKMWRDDHRRIKNIYIRRRWRNKGGSPIWEEQKSSSSLFSVSLVRKQFLRPR